MPLELLAAALAGVAAGTINTIVGSGTLVTFPVLLALGYPPVTANVTNNLGLVPGSLSGTWGYRRELRGQGRRLARLLPATASGAVLGALLLLVLPGQVFAAVVPVLVGLALVLVVAQPRLQRAVRARRERDARRRPTPGDGPGDGHGRHDGPGGGLGGRRDGPGDGHDDGHDDHLPLTVPATLATGVYGGYFGAAQGVILLGVLGALLDDDLQRVNATKNALAGTANVVAAVVFLLLARDQIVWPLVAAVAVGALVGGLLGARLGRRLPPAVLRVVIVVVGLVAIVRLVLG